MKTSQDVWAAALSYCAEQGRVADTMAFTIDENGCPDFNVTCRQVNTTPYIPETLGPWI